MENAQQPVSDTLVLSEYTTATGTLTPPQPPLWLPAYERRKKRRTPRSKIEECRITPEPAPEPEQFEQPELTLVPQSTPEPETMIAAIGAVPLMDTALEGLMATDDPTEAKGFVDWLDVIKVACNRTHQIEAVQVAAAEACIIGRRHVGQLLDKWVPHGGDRTGDSRSTHSTLESMGISKYESTSWRAMARVPEEDFNAEIERVRATDPGILNTTYMVRWAKTQPCNAAKAASQNKTSRKRSPKSAIDTKLDKLTLLLTEVEGHTDDLPQDERNHLRLRLMDHCVRVDELLIRLR